MGRHSQRLPPAFGDAGATPPRGERKPLLICHAILDMAPAAMGPGQRSRRERLKREHLPSGRAQKIGFFPFKSIKDYAQILPALEGGASQRKTTPAQEQRGWGSDLCNSRGYNEVAEKWFCNLSTKGLSALAIFLKTSGALCNEKIRLKGKQVTVGLGSDELPPNHTC